MKRSAVAVLVVLAAAFLVGGCGGGSSGGSSSTAPKKAAAPNAPAGSKVVSCGNGGTETAGLRTAGVDCDTARTTMEQWEQSQACGLAKDDSRNSCSVGEFRCQAARVGEGVSVSCVGPEGDVSFITKRAG